MKRKKSSILFAGGEALESKLKEVRPVGEENPRSLQAGLLASLAGRGRVDVVLEKGMWGWRRLQLRPWVPPTAGTLPRLQTTVTV